MKKVVLITLLALLFTWAGPVRAEKVLNNFVSELLNVSSKAAEGTYSFSNPREGWVFLRGELEPISSGGIKLSVGSEFGQEGAIVHNSVGPVVEGMRYLVAGKHSVHVRVSGAGGIGRLVVRTMPEILYSNFPMDSPITSYPKFDWEFLRRSGVLGNINTIVGARHGSFAEGVKVGQEYEPYLSEWKKMGRRWIVESSVPGLPKGEKVTAEQAYDAWKSWKGISYPKLDGLIADEFYPSRKENYEAWVEAIIKIEKDFAPKVFYPYVAGSPEGLRDFLIPLVKTGTRFAYERYLHERRSEKEAWAFVRDRMVSKMNSFAEVIPNAAEHTIVALGVLSCPPESLNKNPGTNFKVYMDMQFNVLANDPAFVGLYGLMEYITCYADEEYVRWSAKLYRHYCIEGNTEMLSTDPYMLRHIKNPDFEDGTDSWKVSAANKESVVPGSLKDYGMLVMRYPPDSQGDTFLLMKRQAKKPNVISQKIKNLEPGRYYSVKLISGDKHSMGTKIKHDISIAIDGVEMVPEKCFQEVFSNDWSRAHFAYGFDSEHKAWFNLFFKVFQAKSSTAKITISDWSVDGKRVGPTGQELMLNFIEIEPYLMD